MKANAITMARSSPSYGNFAMTAGAAATFALNAKNNFVNASEEFNKNKFDEASKFLTKALDEATKASEKVTQASNFATAPAAPAAPVADAKAPAAPPAADAKAPPAAPVTNYEKDYNDALLNLPKFQLDGNFEAYNTELKKIGDGKDGTNSITCEKDILNKCGNMEGRSFLNNKNGCCTCNNLLGSTSNASFCTPYINSATGRMYYYRYYKKDPYNPN